MDVLVGDPGVVISLILPNATEVTASNAASNGFTFATFSSDGTTGSTDSFTSLSTGGTHTVIQFPIPAQTGIYSVKADATGASADTAMIAWYYPSSSVAMGAATDAPVYRQGDFVVLSGLIFDGTNPVQNATVSAIAGTLLPVNGSIGNYQLVGSTQVDSTYSLYTYTVQFTNAGGAASNVAATVSSSDTNMSIVNDSVAFGSVAVGAIVTGANTFTFLYPSADSYALSALQWTVQAPDTAISVALADTGTYDNATGDGIYTGTFTPVDPGKYIVQVTASGTSASGLPFVRTASTTFQVITPSAQLASFSDEPVTDPNSGQYTSVLVTAAVNVQIAGQYQLSLQLTASNGMTTQAVGSAQLGTGTGQIGVPFFASQILGLGVNGPYTIDNASLMLVTSTDSTLVDYQDPAQATQAYMLSSFTPALSFTGQNSAMGISTNGGTLFNILRVQAGVSLGFPGASQITCTWHATLVDSTGNQIAYFQGGQQLSNGGQVINFDFDGNLIGQTGASGPYTARYAGLECNGYVATTDPLMQISNFAANQFTNVASDFTLTSPPILILPGQSSGQIQLTLSTVGDFSGTVNFSVSNVPNGFTASLGAPSLSGAGFNFLAVTAPTGATPGTTSITITYGTATATKTLNVPITIASQYPVVTVSPASQIVAVGGIQQFSATVTNTSNQGVTWSVSSPSGSSSPIGAIDPVAGVYTAPASIPMQQNVLIIATSAIEA